MRCIWLGAGILANELLRKLEKEKKLFQIRGENIQEQVEEKRLKVLDMEMRLKEMKSDLLRSQEILTLLRENGTGD